MGHEQPYTGDDVEIEDRATLGDPRRAGEEPDALLEPRLLHAWATAERLAAREALERSAHRRAEPGTRLPSTPAAPADWTAMWAVRQFLAERTAAATAAAVAGLHSGAGDPGPVLANSEVVVRLIETWDAVALWADDPDAAPAEAFRTARDGLFQAMCRLAEEHAGHPDHPAWASARS